MEIATLRETVNFTNKTNAVSPFNLGQVLAAYATETYVTTAIAQAKIDPSQIDLSAYAKKTDLPTKLSQMSNDDNYVQTVSGKIPGELLPAYVDDVLEYANKSAFPQPGESGKIYVSLDNNLTWRWSGSEYVEISKSLALGETSATAYRGDRGKTAYDHSQSTGNPHGLSLSDLGILVTTAEINYLEGLSKNIVTALNEKLSLSGGTMTGQLILKGTPTDRLEAATKDYVDTCINGISVTVTQQITKINEITNDLDGLHQTVGAQADTLTEVENSVTGLNQTTQDHTEYINTLNNRADGFDQSISKTTETLTTLEASVNQLSFELAKYYVVIPVDKDNKPLTSYTNETEYNIKFQGNNVTPDTFTVHGTYTGITLTHTDTSINVSVSSDTAITNIDNEYTFDITYVSGGFTYSNRKLLIVTLVKQGEDGQDGQDGKPGEAGRSIIKIEEMYYSSTSKTELKDGTWVTVYPGVQEGHYIWTKTKFTYSSGTPEETSPICVTGDKGEDGVIGKDGTGISRVDVLYYKSTSPTTLSGGKWETDSPTWENGYYIWSKTRTYYIDADKQTWSEDSEPACISGQKGSDGEPGKDGTTGKDGTPGKDGKDAAIISETEPADHSKLWFNTTNNMFYVYKIQDEETGEGEWLIVNDVDLSDINTQLGQLDGTIQNKIDEFNNQVIKETYYTKSEVGTEISTALGSYDLNFKDKTTTIINDSIGHEIETVKDLSGYIHTGTSQGTTYLELGNVSSDFKVKIENDRMAILYKGQEVTHWEQNLFEVQTVISKMLSLGNFAFIVNSDSSLSFRKNT